MITETGTFVDLPEGLFPRGLVTTLDRFYVVSGELAKAREDRSKTQT